MVLLVLSPNILPTLDPSSVTTLNPFLVPPILNTSSDHPMGGIIQHGTYRWSYIEDCDENKTPK